MVSHCSTNFSKSRKTNGNKSAIHDQFWANIPNLHTDTDEEPLPLVSI